MSWMRGETGEPYHETTRHQGCGTSESLKAAPATCVDETRAEFEASLHPDEAANHQRILNARVRSLHRLVRRSFSEGEGLGHLAHPERILPRVECAASFCAVTRGPWRRYGRDALGPAGIEDCAKV